MIATSTSVAYAFACVLTGAVIDRERLHVSRLLSRTSNKQRSNKFCLGKKPARVGLSGTAICLAQMMAHTGVEANDEAMKPKCDSLCC